MCQTIIFANGDLFSEDIFLSTDKMVIAADGGAHHCLNHGITPKIVIGDFDSLTESDIATLESRGVELIHYSTDKDETDLELALNKALELGASQVTLYGLLGGRWDMSIANLLMLAAPRYAGIRFHILAGKTEAFILHGGEKLKLRGQPGDTVSVIPMSASVHGLTYEGLQWPLQNASLSFGTPRGVSNTLAGSQACIRLDEGVLLIIQIHH